MHPEIQKLVQASVDEVSAVVVMHGDDLAKA